MCMCVCMRHDGKLQHWRAPRCVRAHRKRELVAGCLDGGTGFTGEIPAQDTRLGNGAGWIIGALHLAVASLIIAAVQARHVQALVCEGFGRDPFQLPPTTYVSPKKSLLKLHSIMWATTGASAQECSALSPAWPFAKTTKLSVLSNQLQSRAGFWFECELSSPHSAQFHVATSSCTHRLVLSPCSSECARSFHCTGLLSSSVTTNMADSTTSSDARLRPSLQCSSRAVAHVVRSSGVIANPTRMLSVVMPGGAMRTKQSSP